MREIRYVAPTTLDEAVALLGGAGGEARVIAGGTDLVDQLRQKRREARLVVDGKKIAELQRLAYVEGEGLHIGAAVPCTRIYSDPLVRERYPMLVDATSLIGDVKIQNRAGIGGNLCNAAPSADTAPAVMCLEGKAIIAGPKGRREVLVEEFFTSPSRTVLAPDELLVEVFLPPPKPNSAGHYLRFIPRNEMDIAVVGVGSLLVVDPDTKECRDARIALCAVAPTPIRALEAEAALIGRVVEPRAIEEAGEKAAAVTRPIDDIRGSAEYRRKLVKVLTRRTLQKSFDDLSN